MLIILSAISSAMAAVELKKGPCSRVEDCFIFSERLQNSPDYTTSSPKQAGYVCLDGICSYAVATGNICRTNSDCASVGFIQNLIYLNQTSALEFDYQKFIENACSPSHCTIQSDCESTSEPFGKNIQQSCCAGFDNGQTCADIEIETCSNQLHCIPDTNPSSNSRFCGPFDKHSTQWIGITLTLIGAATANFGLNIQKYAHRKRFEKKIHKRESARLGFLQSLSNIKLSLANLYNNRSFSTLHQAEVNTPIHVKSLTVPNEDKQQFQKDLDMNSLLKNPRWILGMLLFIIGNFCNFIALNFAAQSLLAPLNAISLVVNVIVAPILNGELWSWKDIIGVLLIIAGSTIVVVFAGFPPKDYTICVLQKLFRRSATIVFMAVTFSLIFAIRIFIYVIEHNLDLKHASADVIENALTGNLQQITINPPNISEENKPEITIGDGKAEDGHHQKIVTVVSPSKLNLGEKLNNDTIGTSSMDSEKQKNTLGELLRRNSVPSVHSLQLTFSATTENQETKDSGDSTECKSVNEDGNRSAMRVVLVPKMADSHTPQNHKPSRKLKNMLLQLKIFRWLNHLKPPNLENKIPLNSPMVIYILPLCYATLGGLMGTITVLFAKATIHLITATLGGLNQFNTFSSYLFTFLTIFGALSQVYWINMGLGRYDALLQIPVFFVVWTVFDVVGGGIYYDEFSGFKTEQFILFIFGIIIIFVGVAVLAGRLKMLHDDENPKMNHSVANTGENETNNDSATLNL